MTHEQLKEGAKKYLIALIEQSLHEDRSVFTALEDAAQDLGYILTTSPSWTHGIVIYFKRR